MSHDADVECVLDYSYVLSMAGPHRKSMRSNRLREAALPVGSISSTIVSEGPRFMFNLGFIAWI